MDLKLYNTLARERQVFSAIDPSNVRMYVCGPTVYDRAHIGNARPAVVFDVLFRLLKALYGESQVTYARNITDVDDKIIVAAQESGEEIDDITKRTTRMYHEDMGALGVQPPTVEPRATAHIQQMIAMIEALIERGYAYEAEGQVLFHVPAMQNYGKLSRHSRDELIAGARVDVAPYKKDPADFTLWKPSSPEQPGWDSPWGRGRPGWHIECSAMSARHLGETFDIHGGGQDLIFPHHENEIAQSCCANGTDVMANYWVHNGYVVVNGEKMSKSLGNFFTVRDLLDEGFRGEAIRLTLLSAHYRQPLDVTRDKIKEMTASLDRLYGALRQAPPVGAAEEAPEAVLDALSDDLNTPLAVAALHELAGELNRAEVLEKRLDLAASLRAGGVLLGLLEQDPEDWFQGESAGGPSAREIEALIQKRKDARAAKDFAEADRIRDELQSQGVVLEDGPAGTTWRRG